MSVQRGAAPGGRGAGPPELSFVLVNWNGATLLRRAIESILQFPPRVPYGIVVIDNASTDESVHWLRSQELAERLGRVELRLIENRENAGFGRANNQAFASTRARLLFLLNTDAELKPGACDALVATLESDPRIGACGPRLVNPDGSLQVSVWRNPPTAWSTLLSGLRLYTLLPRRLRGELLLAGHWAHDRRRDVEMLSGAALLVRREVVEDVGGFDERFHMYGEDNEWCLRMARAGWRLVFEPAAVVMHHGGQSSQRRWTAREQLDAQLDAFFRFQRYSLSRRQAVSNLLATSVLLSVHRLWRGLRGQPADDVTLTLRMHLADLKRTLRSPRSPGVSSE
jgi:GT2 family glycosyltransferase